MWVGCVMAGLYSIAWWRCAGTPKKDHTHYFGPACWSSQLRTTQLMGFVRIRLGKCCSTQQAVMSMIYLQPGNEASLSPGICMLDWLITSLLHSGAGIQLLGRMTEPWFLRAALKVEICGEPSRQVHAIVYVQGRQLE